LPASDLNNSPVRAVSSSVMPATGFVEQQQLGILHQ